MRSRFSLNLLLSVLTFSCASFSAIAADTYVDYYARGQEYVQKSDFENARKAFTEAIHRGENAALIDLAQLYETGKGTTVDLKKAAALYEEAAQRGLKEAQYKIGILYADGIGVSQNPTHALYWLNKAEANGHPDAANIRGKVERYLRNNYTEDFRKTQEMAESGRADAQYKLGMMYRDGIGTVKNLVRATEWLKKSAEQGLFDAQAKLGVMYYEGLGIAPDPVEAFHWTKLAAEQGYAPSQALLATMYRDGRGTEKNLATAYHWFLIALMYGNKSAEASADALLKTLTPEQIATGEQLTKEWVKNHLTPKAPQNADEQPIVPMPEIATPITTLPDDESRINAAPEKTQ
ncbi:TPR repeat-containing protein [Beggiatoa alba B18LD]|uniref:TPR repeat-containing protein n=1 Tax=Beggiatoa alba B18LD TaxID=395493 RepID=I3CGD1_9GAMM|nr:SEL1-like repeat protein [Beggiatoa alba]EIJ42674.1 TPR repeat-containing protein [Beggiatoa alba B18LD]